MGPLLPSVWEGSSNGGGGAAKGAAWLGASCCGEGCLPSCGWHLLTAAPRRRPALMSSRQAMAQPGANPATINQVTAATHDQRGGTMWGTGGWGVRVARPPSLCDDLCTDNQPDSEMGRAT